jgi:hypothetical protein
VLLLFDEEAAAFIEGKMQKLDRAAQPPDRVSQSFFLSANKTAFVSPQVLESHHLTPGLSRINLFYFFCNVFLHCIFHRNVLAIGGSIVARYGFAKAFGGVGATVKRTVT